MSLHLKIPRELYYQIKVDLKRDHSFAYERVGFAFGKIGNLNHENQLILLNGYMAVTDEDYIDDRSVGASINSEAIRKALQATLDGSLCAFHVHAHVGRGRPGLSRPDMKGIIPILPSFRAVSPSCVHGIILLNQDNISAWVLSSDGKDIVPFNKISIIGYPIELIR